MRTLIKLTTRMILTSVALAILLTAVAAPAAWANLTVKANHDDIKIGYNYHGSTVSISGISDPGTDLILKVSSENTAEKFMRKDKVGGFLWMNVEEINLENVPDVYFLRSTKDPGQLLDAARLKENGIGYDAISANASIEPLPAREKKNTLFADFIKYQESSSKFSQSVGGIDIKQEAGGQSYYTMLDWPYQVAPGDYQVTAYAVKDGAVVEKAQTKVLVENVGEVQALSNMATNNSALYGAAAILVAIAAGFGVGIVFRSGGGAH